MFFYTIMKLFITFLENVKKSRTSAGRLSLSVLRVDFFWGFVPKKTAFGLYVCTENNAGVA
jgi:hypothetical protein